MNIKLTLRSICAHCGPAYFEFDAEYDEDYDPVTCTACNEIYTFSEIRKISRTASRQAMSNQPQKPSQKTRSDFQKRLVTEM